MSKNILRFVGGCVLGLALLMSWVHHNSISRVTGVSQDITFQKGNMASLTFTPALENASYSITLEFDKTQKISLDCYTIQSSGIEWSLLREEKPLLIGNLHGPKASCNDKGETVIVDFLAPELTINHKHSLNLSITNKVDQKIKLHSHVSIIPSGISVHYAFADLFIQEIIGVFLFIVGSACFLPDVCRFLFSSNSQKNSV